MPSDIPWQAHKFELDGCVSRSLAQTKRRRWTTPRSADRSARCDMYLCRFSSSRPSSAQLFRIVPDRERGARLTCDRLTRPLSSSLWPAQVCLSAQYGIRRAGKDAIDLPNPRPAARDELKPRSTFALSIGGAETREIDNDRGQSWSRSSTGRPEDGPVPVRALTSSDPSGAATARSRGNLRGRGRPPPRRSLSDQSWLSLHLRERSPMPIMLRTKSGRC